MIRSLISKIFLSVLLGWVFCIVITSCDNFLQGSDFYSQLTNDIAYAQAEFEGIYIDKTNPAGTFPFSTEKENCKLNYSIEVQFKLNKADYVFKGFEAVCKDDFNISRNDFVEFLLMDEDEERGIYNVQIKLVKPAKDILIRPVCFKYPAVINRFPSDSNEVKFANTPIKIFFNTCMNEDVVSNIRLSYLGTDMRDYFNEPVLSDDRTVVTIEPKRNDLRSDDEGHQLLDISEVKKENPLSRFILEQKKAFIDLTVSLSKETFVEADDKKLYLKTDSNTDFTVRYGYMTDEISPVAAGYEIIASRKEFSFQELETISDSDKFYLEDYNISENDYQDEKLDSDRIIQNRTDGVFYIYGNFFDADSGVKTVRITEQLVNEPENCRSVDEEKFTHDYSEDDEDTEFINDDNGNTKFRIKHNLKSKDGAVLITVTVFDAVGNYSETELFTVIKMSQVCFWNMYLYNIPKNKFEIDEDNAMFIETRNLSLNDYLENAKNIKIYKYKPEDYNYKMNFNTPIPDLAEIVYGDVTVLADDFQIFCDYVDRYGVSKTVPFSEYDPLTNCWNLDLDLDTLSGQELKITVIDDIGIRGEEEFFFPENYVYKKIEDRQPYKKITFETQNGGYFNGELCFKTDENGCVETSISSVAALDVYPEYSYTISPYLEGLFGDLQQVNIQNQITVQEVEIENVTVSKAKEGYFSNNGFLDIEVSVKDDSWSRYDVIYAVLEAENNGYSKKTFYFDKGNCNQILNCPTGCIYSDKIIIKVYGVADSFISDPVTWEIPKTTDSKYDNIIPGFYMKSQTYITRQQEYEYNPVTIFDNGSGLDYARLKIGDWEFESTDEFSGEEPVMEYTIKIPTFILADLSQTYNTNGSRTFYVDYEIRDKGGNLKTRRSTDRVDASGYKITDNYIFLDAMFPRFKSFVKTDDAVTSVYGKNCYNWKFSTDKVSFNKNPQGYHFLIKRSIFNQDTGKWQIFGTEYRNDISRESAGDELYKYVMTARLPENEFVKLDCRFRYNFKAENDPRNAFNFMDPVYVYTGTPGSPDSDYLLANGTSKSSVIICSETPVLVHTVITKRPYEECKDWAEDEWKNYHKVIDEKLINFSSGSGAKRYNIPMDKINAGECYVVIAHYASGEILLSQVMQK